MLVSRFLLTDSDPFTTMMLEFLTSMEGRAMAALDNLLGRALLYPFHTLLITTTLLVLREALVDLLVIRLGILVYLPLHIVASKVLLAPTMAEMLVSEVSLDLARAQEIVGVVSLLLSPLMGWHTSCYVRRNVMLRKRHRRLYQPQGIRTPGSLLTDCVMGYAYGVLSIAVPIAVLLAGTGLGAVIGQELAEGEEWGALIGGLIGVSVGSKGLFAFSHAIHHSFGPYKLWEEVGRDDPGSDFQPLLREPNQHPQGHQRGGR